MQNQKIQKLFFLILVAIALVLTGFILLPYLSILALTAALAIVFTPLNNLLLKTFKQSRTITTLVSVFLILLIVLAPLTFFGWQIFQEAKNLYGQTRASHSPVSDFMAGLQIKIQHYFPRINFNFNKIININGLAEQSLSWMLKHSGSLFSGFAKIALGFVLSIISLFYFLKDGPEIKKYLIKISPLSDQHDQLLFLKIKMAMASVLKGTLLIAIVQGIFAGLGFKIFGVPSAALWGCLTVIAALIPGLGVSLTIAPVIAYLLINGHLWSGLGMALWGIVAVGLIDNILNPRLMKKGLEIHPLLILLSVLGGIQVFGPMGFLLGPIIVSFSAALLKIYPELVLEK
ncbi:hypothetical protein COT20_01095 [bacterium (Candidatus Gribaldobacteria) CG08_land_8_20_14_0_20_39_15]|uniref:AI-2E family transporter n=1 Tax=bacterium (Candidatus Gribaldobacteria) CG08_land_8_20_14_0_20_39_15 TaxID=2014273 RepID=A0A2M6XUY2_9BACT|nr:MAG: hypothetical protein COT20_01095 [bacterium (Candidatus Gribaldobacteria) CG08_land_8_20_14_0_20_39_15]